MKTNPQKLVLSLLGMLGVTGTPLDAEAAVEAHLATLAATKPIPFGPVPGSRRGKHAMSETNRKGSRRLPESVPLSSPSKHWNRAALARHGLKKARSVVNGRKVTSLIPIELQLAA